MSCTVIVMQKEVLNPAGGNRIPQRRRRYATWRHLGNKPLQRENQIGVGGSGFGTGFNPFYST
jgi:hypothetical protein